MTHMMLKLSVSIGLMTLVASPSFADKPKFLANTGSNNYEQHATAASASSSKQGQHSSYFNHDRQAIIRSYYSEKTKTKHCPPGLAKKNNGCQPPGQIKQWKKGQRLPADLAYYDLPSTLIDRLGRSPEGHKLIRVGSDLLLINIASGVIVDALEDLKGLF